MNWENIIVIGFLVLHLAFHVIGAIGVTVGLIHSNNVHRASKWKLIFAVLWVIVSIVVIWNSRAELFGIHTTCH